MILFFQNILLSLFLKYKDISYYDNGNDDDVDNNFNDK